MIDLVPAELERVLDLLSLADDVPGPQASPSERKVALRRWADQRPQNADDVLAALAVVRSGKRSPATEAALWPHTQRAAADRMPVLMHRTGEGRLHPRLDALLVDVELQREDRRADERGFEGARDGDAERSLGEALAIATRSRPEFGTRGVILIGMPGSGKSTLLKSQLLADAKDPDRAPTVLLRFATLQQLGVDSLEAGALLRWAAREAADVGHPGAAHVLLGDRTRRYRFLLDGFDELARPEDRAAVARWLVTKEFACWSGADFVITTRRAAWEEADRGALQSVLDTWTLLRLRREAVRGYVRRWFPLLARFETRGDEGARVERVVTDYTARGEALIKDVLDAAGSEASRVERLVGNPLLLSVVCLIYREQGRLPQNRADLYEKCFEVLIHGRRMDGRMTGFRREAGLILLGPLAWEMQSTSERLDSPKELAKPAVIAALEAAREQDSEVRDTPGAALLDRLVEECALLVTGDRAHYSFAHLSFQEFAAYQHALREGRVDELARAATDPRWREPILLGMSDAPFQRAFFGELAAAPGSFARLPPALIEAMILEKRSTADFEPGPFAALLLRADAQAADLRVVLDIFRRGARKSVMEAAAGLVEHPDATVAALAAEVSGKPRSGVRWLKLPSGPPLALVPVPGAEFWMGASKEPGSRNFDARAYEDESPVHRARVAPFWMGQHPVTNAQYRAFVKAKGHPEPGAWRREGFERDDQPVTTVDWADARAFCAWLTSETGEPVELPTEAQWEWAARGEEALRYPWGQEGPTPERAVFGGAPLAPVGGRPAGASPFGVHDMAGNVWEWTVSPFRPYVSGADKPVDKGSDAAPRVVRGGSWGDPSWALRAASRYSWRPAYRLDSDLGFRVCVLREPVP